jgi:hypothetical protein
MLWPEGRAEPAQASLGIPTKLVIRAAEPPAAILEKPLLNVERSPMEAIAPEAASFEEAAQPSSPPQLVGAVVRTRRAGVALVRNATGETVMLRPGEEADGWRLVSVGSSQAIFDQSGRRETVTLDFSNRDQPANAAPEAQAPAPTSAPPTAYAPGSRPGPTG